MTELDPNNVLQYRTAIFIQVITSSDIVALDVFPDARVWRKDSAHSLKLAVGINTSIDLAAVVD